MEDEELMDRLCAAVKAGEPYDDEFDELIRRGHSVGVFGSNVLIDCTFEESEAGFQGIEIK